MNKEINNTRMIRLKTIFNDGELIEDAVIKKYLITANDSKK